MGSGREDLEPDKSLIPTFTEQTWKTLSVIMENTAETTENRPSSDERELDEALHYVSASDLKQINAALGLSMQVLKKLPRDKSTLEFVQRTQQLVKAARQDDRKLPNDLKEKLTGSS
jgi:hypothetical protein